MSRVRPTRIPLACFGGLVVAALVTGCTAGSGAGPAVDSTDATSESDVGVNAAAGAQVADYFVNRDQRKVIVDTVVHAVSTWRTAADACGIARAEMELFAPLLDQLPQSLRPST